MADHIGQIEERMISEIELWTSKQPGFPSYDDLMQIPARPPDWLVQKLKAEMEKSKREAADLSSPETK